MRTFIAVDVPDDVKMKVGDYLETLKETFDKRKVKWVLPENLHFTIKFLGEVKKSELENLIQCVSQTASRFDSFTLGLSGLGFFPSEHKPRVLWIGADGGADCLLEVYQDLESCLEAYGYDRDAKPFSPHLTVGRVRKHEKLIVPDRYDDFEPVYFQVEGLSIIKSNLTPQGPIYEKLFQSKFEKDFKVHH